MNIVPSKIVIGVGLAIVGAGLVTYALHPSSTPAPIARVAPIAPPPPVVQEAPPPVAPATETPADATPAPVAPPVVAQTDNSTANSDATPAVVTEPKASRHAKAHRSATNDDSVAATAPAAPVAAPTGTASTDSSANAGSNSVAKNDDSVKPADASIAPAAPAAAAAAPEGAPAVDVANADTKITTEVKSRLAADSVTKDADLSVNTSQGVVVVTGTVATQDAVDHVKLVAQNVPDVKSVDTSALKVSG
jgi:hyperosmotically inducible periplasmic protein